MDVALLKKSAKKAVGGGTAGALAMVVQTVSLMWMRTIMNYQYRFGLTTRQAFDKLYADGGFARLYKGFWWALLQAPMSRFGDTAANSLALELLRNSNLHVALKTFFASLCAGVWRIFLSPVDAYKTSMQVSGSTKELKEKVQSRGFISLYDGAMGTYVATAVGHFPWFVTNNFLDQRLKKPNDPFHRLLRTAFIGLVSTIISDCVSNSMRVLKTVKQTQAEDITYIEAARRVVEKDGLTGLFGRGLQTKLLSNSVQSIFFSVLWRHFESLLTEKRAA